MAVAAQKVGAVLVGDEEEEIRTGGVAGIAGPWFDRCDTILFELEATPGTSAPDPWTISTPQESLLQIVLVTGVIGGGAAFLAGRAIAQTWRPFWHVVLYMLLLGAAVRFVHFALFEGTLLSPASYAADTLYLLLLGALAWRMTRAAQMATQYYWLYAAHRPADLARAGAGGGNSRQATAR